MELLVVWSSEREGGRCALMHFVDSHWAQTTLPTCTCRYCSPFLEDYAEQNIANTLLEDCELSSDDILASMIDNRTNTIIDQHMLHITGSCLLVLDAPSSL